jgi:hypothetical protein
MQRLKQNLGGLNDRCPTFPALLSVSLFKIHRLRSSARILACPVRPGLFADRSNDFVVWGQKIWNGKALHVLVKSNFPEAAGESSPEIVTTSVQVSTRVVLSGRPSLRKIHYPLENDPHLSLKFTLAQNLRYSVCRYVTFSLESFSIESSQLLPIVLFLTKMEEVSDITCSRPAVPM